MTTDPALLSERFVVYFPDPDDVGSSEYLCLYELLETVIASAEYDGSDPIESARSALDETLSVVARFAAGIDRLAAGGDA